jgi:hypothetical protein
VKRLLPLLLLFALLGVPAAAFADKNQEATFQDDDQLIYTTSKAREKTLDTLKRLGVDRIRATVLWRVIAPSPTAKTKPSPFDSSNPADYPPGVWNNYDQLVRGAKERGIAVNFNVSGPAPRWATKAAPRPDIQDTYEPDPKEFASFVAAVGRRYDGTYPGSDYEDEIPRVSYWSIWNEPNHSGWLTPTWQKGSSGPFYPRSAALYRSLAQGAYIGLGVSGHAKDTILIGELAPTGNNSRDVKRFMKPLVFLRAMYCLNNHNKRLTGKAAMRLDCPKTGKEMVTNNSILFKATGFAEHPYQGLSAPNVKGAKDTVTMGTLHRLTHTLDVAQRRYGQHRKLPLYLTEYGYQSTPEIAGVSPKKQAEFINQSEYIAYKNKRVKTLGQFLLVDGGKPIGLTFQTGLEFRKGKRKKPAYNAYRVPIWVRGSGPAKKYWGVLRPANNGTRARAKLQFRPDGGKWKTIKKVKSHGLRNIVTGKVTLSTAGSLRLVYKGGPSRTVKVSP